MPTNINWQFGQITATGLLPGQLCYFKCCQLSLKVYKQCNHVLDQGNHWEISTCQTPWETWPSLYLLQSPGELTLTALSHSWSSYGVRVPAGAVRLMINSTGERTLLKNSSLHARGATSWSAPLTIPARQTVTTPSSLPPSLFHHPASKPLRRNGAQPVLSPWCFRLCTQPWVRATAAQPAFGRCILWLQGFCFLFVPHSRWAGLNLQGHEKHLMQ